MNNEPKAIETSFWSLLSKEDYGFTIYIPQIQRDYAQGRDDAVINQIRNKLVDDLMDSVVEGKVLDLNFIYGNIEEQGKIERFIPIDGQQRLTTLFLFHWYFAVLSGQIEKEEVKESLLRFRYETRDTTGTFCENLVKDVRTDLLKLPKEKKVSDVIRNYYWFFSDFENDPSIKGMLVMIDTIHEKARKLIENGTLLDNVFDLLVSDKAPVRFLYMNLNDVGLTDSIYIKMNARGKALTHFENFKAQLQGFLAKDNNKFADQFIKNINGRWAEFFWNEEYRKTIKDPNTGAERLETVFDSQMMRFFRFWMQMEYIVHASIEEAAKNNQYLIRDSLTKLSGEQDYIFTARLFDNGFRDVYGLRSESEVLNIDTFIQIDKLLNILFYRQQTTGTIVFTTEEYRKQYVDEKDAFCKVIGITGGKNDFTNEDRILSYAEYAFLIKYANQDGSFNKELELTRWLRLVYNLIQATLNLQNDTLFRMIRAINELIESGHALDCERYISRMIRHNNRQDGLSAFEKAQAVEESIKSILMSIDPNWKEAIIEAENTFLDGQIRVLLSFAGVTTEYENQIKQYEDANQNTYKLGEDASILSGIDSGSQQYQDFLKYLSKFRMIFDLNGVKKELEEGALFRRALLCYGGTDSYMLPPGRSIQSFLDNFSRDCSFWRLFRDNSNKCWYLKELMDDICVDQPIIEQLQLIIDRKEFDEGDRWKKYFIKIPEILDCVKQSNSSKKDPKGEWVFKVSQRFIFRNGNDNILLLTKTQTNSVNRELYSYVLFLKAQKMGLAVEYHADAIEGTLKYAWYINQDNEKRWIEYKKSDDIGYAFLVKEWDKDEESKSYKTVERYKTIEETLDYIQRTIKQ